MYYLLLTRKIAYYIVNETAYLLMQNLKWELTAAVCVWMKFNIYYARLCSSRLLFLIQVQEPITKYICIVA